jgi:hypothetical protein
MAQTKGSIRRKAETRKARRQRIKARRRQAMHGGNYTGRHVRSS